MAEENNHAAAAGNDEDEIDQENIRNLHIDGKFIVMNKQIIAETDPFVGLFADDDRFADAEEN